MGLNFTVKLIIIGIISYAMGNLNPSIIISKLYGVDIRKEGSGNPGTTNVIRTIGLKSGILTLGIDVLKAFVAVRLGMQFAGLKGGMVAFAAVVLGHCFPAIYRFKGGKGVAASFGAAIAFNWPSAFAMFIIAMIVLFIWRRMSLASIVAAVTYPVLMYFYEPEGAIFTFAVAAFVLIMHAPNIKRLLKGEEPPLSFGRKDKSDESSDPDKKDNDKTDINVKKDVPITEDEKQKILNDNIEYSDMENGESPVAAEATKEPSLITAHSPEGIRPEPQPMDYFADVSVPDLGKEKKKIGVIGNGSFGTAISNLLSYNGHDVTLYGRNKNAIKLMEKTRMNERYLPYVILSDKIKYTYDLKSAVKGKDILIYAVPTQKFREASQKTSKFIEDGTIAVNLAKGIEQKSLKRLSEIAIETIPNVTYVVLSGPSHAEELARNCPASVVVASRNKAAAEIIQDVFMSEKFRVYTQEDMLGVEIAGAVKNVIAITTGISDGMKLGSNARAALMTRAIHEIKRLGDAMGANLDTFSGLSGIGDLIVTCSTNLSRNRRCGLLIGLGLDVLDAVERVGSVVEGYFTAEAVVELAKKYKVEMPICETTYGILQGKVTTDKALTALMTRDKKDELQ
ncbi:MAG TPA: glycerol-3-phosphate 1-O-acyltransferase PlsY [Mogibacterium sp.]|nr:glycerol-3-phosphate 1-O-acyltransferase PlsY [Mogibacterium sp.]